MKIIGVAGWPNSGKTSVSRMFEDKGYTLLGTGDILRGLVDKHDWNPSDLIGLGKHIRKRFGKGIVIKECIKKIKNENINKVIVEGLRLLIEDEELRKEFGDDYKLIGVICKKEIRIKRAKERNRIDDANPEQKEEREKKHYQTDDLIKKADILIDNNGSVKDLKDNINKIMEGFE